MQFVLMVAEVSFRGYSVNAIGGGMRAKCPMYPTSTNLLHGVW